MQDSEKRIIFRFVSAIQIASRVIFFLEVSIKIILTHNIKWCILLAPHIGQARIHLFYLPHPQIFSINPCFFAEEAILSNHGDMFLDMALPIHNFTYIQAYRAKSVKLRQPSWYLLIHPSHNIHHFIVYHLNFIEIPTNSFIMIYPIAQATEFV